MTAPARKTLDRERGKLFLTDAELIRRLGVPERRARLIIRQFDEKTDFPKKQALWGGRRYWPAVKAWLDRHSGVTL